MELMVAVWLSGNALAAIYKLLLLYAGPDNTWMGDYGQVLR